MHNVFYAHSQFIQFSYKEVQATAAAAEQMPFLHLKSDQNFIFFHRSHDHLHNSTWRNREHHHQLVNEGYLNKILTFNFLHL